MIIEINDSKTIGDIQDKFSTFFPFLKIEFYERPHHWHEGSESKTAFPRDKKLGEIRKNHPHGALEIHSWYRTGDLEQAFHKKFILNVQVLRLHGNHWVQTAGTDKLTLKEQNEIGRNATVENNSLIDSVTERNNLY